MRRIACLALATLAAASTAGAALLSVDFGLNTAPVQTGFVGFGVANPGPGLTSIANSYPVSGVTSGSITVTVPGTSVGGRDRGAITGSGSFTYSDLYRDLLTQLSEGTSATTVTVQLSGLNPNTDYSLQIWSNDRNFNDNAVYSWYDTTSGTSAVLLGTITNRTGAAAALYPNNDVFSLVATVRSSAAGVIKLGHNDPVGNGTLNGLAISSVPEPGSMAVLGIALLIGGLGRRTR